MPYRYTLLFLFIFLPILRLQAQSDGKEVRLRNFKLETQHVDNSGRKGIALQFDLRFNWVEDDFRSRNFDLTWRLEDQNGKVVLNSSEQKEYTDKKKRVAPRPPFRDRNPSYMEKRRVRISLPHKLLNLATGPQTVTVFFSLTNASADFPDFAQETLNFDFQEIVEYPFSEQEFTVSNLEFRPNQNGFAVDVPGLKIAADLQPKYGQDETAATGYTLYCVLQDSTGQVVFDSRKAKSVHHREENIYFKRLREGKYWRNVFFLSYDEIRMPGPGNVKVIFLAQPGKEKPRQIYAATHHVPFPKKYRFSEQEFTVSKLESDIAERKGVRGIRIRGRVQLSKIGPRLDPKMGDYYIYPEIRDQGGNVLYTPAELDPNEFQSSMVTQACPAYKGKGLIDINLFIPWYRLKLPPGKTFLQYSLRASNQSKTVRFPELSKGGRVAEAPRLRKYHFSLTHLIMEDGDYDVEFLKTGSHKPDMQWSLQIGRDNAFVSQQINNTLSGPPGQVEIIVAEGDALSVVLYDVDSGFFNRSDWIGRWEIPYQENTGSFVYDLKQQDQLHHLRIEMDRKP